MGGISILSSTHWGRLTWDLVGRGHTVRQIVKKPEELFRPEPFLTERGWGIQYRVTGEFIRRYFPDLRLEGQSACNFYKCGDRTLRPHYLSWSPMTAKTPDFHRRQDFGTIRFD